MKKVLLFAAMLAMAASCTLYDAIVGTTGPDITASFESHGTKSSITTDEEGVGTIWWMPADEINVFYGTTSTHYISKNKENATTVAFGTTDIIGSTESASENIWGLYPYDEDAVCDGESVSTTIPATQQAIAGTFDDDIFTSLAHSTSTVMTFYNVLGGIKFSLSRDDIQTITFKGNNDEDIAGKVSLSMDANGKPVAEITEGEKTITLTPKEGTTFASGTNYYIVMLPTILSNGFTMTFETETAIGTFEYTTKSIEIKRSVFSKKENIDGYATFVSKAQDHEYVDLGIRKSHIDSRIEPGSKYDRKIVFAKCNIGAKNPEDFGYYFRWGELCGWKINSNGYNRADILSAYQYDNNGNVTDSEWSVSTFSDSYPLASLSSVVDYKGKIDLQCEGNIYGDAATYCWGGAWVTPNEELLNTLFSSTEFTDGQATKDVGNFKNGTVRLNYSFTSLHQVKGLQILNPTLGTSIFLPAAGDCYQNQIDYGADATPIGNYTCSTPLPISTTAVMVEFLSTGFGVTTTGRFCGLPIRPIAELTLSDEIPEPIELPTLGTVEIKNIEYTKATISSSLISDGNAITECGFYYGSSATDLNNKVRIVGYSTGDFSKEISPLAKGTTYYIKAYATNESGTVESEVISFTTLSSKGTINGYEWVDLGIRKSHFDNSITPGSEADKRIVFAANNIGATTGTSNNNLGYYFRKNELYGWKFSGDASGNLNSTNLEQVYNDGSTRGKYINEYPGIFNPDGHEEEEEYTTGDAVTYYYGAGWEYMPAMLAYKLSCRSNYSFNTSAPEGLSIYNNVGSVRLKYTFYKNMLVISNDELATSVRFPMAGYLDGGVITGYLNGETGCCAQALNDGRNMLYMGTRRSYDEDGWYECWDVGFNSHSYTAYPIRPVAELPIK